MESPTGERVSRILRVKCLHDDRRSVVAGRAFRFGALLPEGEAALEIELAVGARIDARQARVDSPGWPATTIMLREDSRLVVRVTDLSRAGIHEGMLELPSAERPGLVERVPLRLTLQASERMRPRRLVTRLVAGQRTTIPLRIDRDLVATAALAPSAEPVRDEATGFSLAAVVADAGATACTMELQISAGTKSGMYEGALLVRPFHAAAYALPLEYAVRVVEAEAR